jgi:predicted ATPase
VSLRDSGAGIAQVLPLIVAVRLAQARPSLFCIEQPELHLHPRAHVAIAELLLECVTRRPSTRLLVETHSDVLVLRVRRAIAAGELEPRDVRIYFVDEDSVEGSRVQEIELDERATPRWWPKDVFGEPQREYLELRRELARRGLVP